MYLIIQSTYAVTKLSIDCLTYSLIEGISKFITLYSICFLVLQLFSILFRAFCIVYLSMQESQLVAGRWGRVSIYRHGNPTSAPSIVHFDVVTVCS